MADAKDFSPLSITNWECVKNFREVLACLHQNKDGIAKCQEVYSNFEKCIETSSKKSIVETIEERVFDNRFLTEADDFGREEGFVASFAKKILPQVFDDKAEKKVSTLTQKLQEKMPRIFVESEEDEEDGGDGGDN